MSILSAVRKLGVIGSLVLFLVPLAMSQRAYEIRPGVFLVANQGMMDPRFSQSVVLLVDYSPEGAWGLIVNRPSRISLQRALPELQTGNDVNVFFGGPVKVDRLLFISESAGQGKSREIAPNLYFIQDLEEVSRLFERGDRVKAFAGYAGWGAGQLDEELAADDWQLARGTAQQVFDKEPLTLWQRIMKTLSTIQV